jgi:hypothetical protein
MGRMRGLPFRYGWGRLAPMPQGRAVFEFALPLGEEADGSADGEAAEHRRAEVSQGQKEGVFGGASEPEEQDGEGDEEDVVTDHDGAAASLGFDWDEDEESASGFHLDPPCWGLPLP